MRKDYYKGLYFNDIEDLKKAKEILSLIGIDVIDCWTHKALAYCEADNKLDSEEWEELYNESDNKVEITDAIFEDLAEEIYDNEYLIDSDAIDNSVEHWIERNKFHFKD